MSTMPSSFVGLPNETIIQICHSLHSLQEVHRLGLTCKRLYGVLSSIDYRHLCRILLCVSGREKSSDSIARSLSEADSLGWATALIAQSIAEALDRTPHYFHGRGPPKKDRITLQGCQNWPARKEIFAAFLSIPAKKSSSGPFRRVCFWLEQGEWEDRFTQISKEMILRMAYEEKGETAHYMLSSLCECLRFHGEPYNLSEIEDLVRARTGSYQSCRLCLVWTGDLF